ncbi:MULTISPECIES: hypothetical protein [unclassified Lentimonas]|uniref:hypothetical protein n=1 Tax=unclassified Lentimonas TaxID=2630993 RepID=UPI001322213D|nr:MULTISPECIES: hypothetical protein [unclassified Lentimonas]CAA6677356.1 Unannotated [Lentimonas sp. CC4]CAA6686901.1 Unannotated [Lentimonas sp. CC6]CAA7074602.1 Unannotated [Lentimonas sp. CC4]CAA7169218.1 Unannotated [Lentimonas sp. CC21]CAA7180381.1 Unannotated [Lentimonas sp. CC8]
MIIRFIIRPVLALLMLIACLAATPYILDWVTQLTSPDGNAAETFSRVEVLQKVQALYESKPLSEMTMDDLQSLINSEETEQLSDKKKAELSHMLTEELELSPEEIISLGTFYQKYLEHTEVEEDASMADTPDSSIRESTGLKPAKGL